MKAFCAAMALTIVLMVAGPDLAATAGEPAASKHRYLIERTFPAGALDGVDAATKQKVNSNNKTLDVIREKSYATADKTRTCCVYAASVRGDNDQKYGVTLLTSCGAADKQAAPCIPAEV